MIFEKIREDQTNAQKSRDMRLLGVLRLLTSSLNYKMIDLKVDTLPDEVATAVLRIEVNRRKEAIEIYERAKDELRTEQEKYELEVIERYLPQLMGEEEVRKIVEETAKESGESGGQLIGLVMAKLRGRADGGMVARIVSCI